MTFQLPAGLPREAAGELERSYRAGGSDNMPQWTHRALHGDLLRLTREVSEGGYLVAPWRIDGLGWMMGSSATLMERDTPYQLLVELARGKVNQVRSQAADWQAGGVQIAPDLQEFLRDSGLAFARALCGTTMAEVNDLSGAALRLGYQGAGRLIQAYTDQVFRVRHHRQPRLETGLSCRIGPSVLDPNLGQHLVSACNRVGIPLSWHIVEAEQGQYDWKQADALLEWAEENELDVTAGPLLDFSSSQLPSWLWLWEGDLPSIATFMGRFVEAAVRRYRARIRRWQLTAGTNWANVLRLSEDDLMALTFRLGDASRQVDPALELIVGVAQPWGEYRADHDRVYSPFEFADNLIRSGLNVSGLELEVVMGVRQRGSYCRDVLELSRLLDLYALLSAPVYVTLGYPAGAGADPSADPEVQVGAGRWRDGFSASAQADWTAVFLPLALCKAYVHGVQWCHFCDADPHLFPHCGLLDAQGNPRPALELLRHLRQQHLR